MAWRFGANGTAEFIDEEGGLGQQKTNRVPDFASAPLIDATGGGESYGPRRSTLMDAAQKTMLMSAPAMATAGGQRLIDPALTVAEARPEAAGAGAVRLIDVTQGPGAPAGTAASNPGGTRPIIQATLARPGADGIMRPVDFRRDTPMSVAQARTGGLIDVTQPPKTDWSKPLQVETPGQVQMIDAMRTGRDARMEMTSPDAQAMRQGFRDVATAGRAAAAGRATGKTGTNNRHADAVLENIRGVELAGQRAAIETAAMRERPQAAAGDAGNSTWDPVTQQWTTAMAERGAPQKFVPQTWDEYTPEDLEGIVNRTMKSMMPPEEEQVFRMKLSEAKTAEQRAEVYKKFAPQTSPEQRVILDNAYEALTRKSIVKGGERGAEAGGRRTESGGGATYRPGMFAKK